MKPETRRLLALLSIAALMLGTLSTCGDTAPAANQEGSSQKAEPAVSGTEPLKRVSLSSGQKLQVVATTNIVGDVVSNVGADRIELTTLMGVGVDPHSYVPTPADTAAIHDANVVFANGAGLEAGLEEMFKSAGGDAVKIYLSDGLELHQAEAGDAHGGGGQGQRGFDAHVWFDVQNVIHWVETIQRALSALDPANAQFYAEKAGEYTRELEDLDAWIVEQVAQIPEAHRKLVTNHPAFGYFAGRYGLEQLGAVYPVSPSSEPSARDIASLEDAIREYAVPAVFTENTVNPKLAEQVAQDTGVRLVALYTGSLGGPSSGAESYAQLIRFDVSTIVEALR